MGYVAVNVLQSDLTLLNLAPVFKTLTSTHANVVFYTKIYVMHSQFNDIWFDPTFMASDKSNRHVNNINRILNILRVSMIIFISINLLLRILTNYIYYDNTEFL